MTHSLFPKENFVTIYRVICVVGLLSAVAVQAAPQGDGYWVPDSKTVDRIEQTIRHMPLPTLGNWTATSIDSYGRYYTGETPDGHKVVIGVFLAMDPVRYPRGIHIVPYTEQPHMTGGLCAQLSVWYDVAEDRVKGFHCYGIG